MANEFIDEAYLNYLLETGALYDQLSPIGTDELKDEGSYLTQASKMGNSTTDLDWLIANDALSHGAYDPITTVSPVDAAGWRETQKWLNSSSPYQQFVAQQLDLDADPLTIMASIQNMVANPEEAAKETGAPLEMIQSIISSIPRGPAIDAAGNPTGDIGDKPDLMGVKDSIQGLYDMRSRDPEYTIQDGRPIIAESENSPASQKLLEAGYTTTPGQAFDPYDLAPAGTRERDLGYATAEDKAMAAMLKAREAYGPAADASRQARQMLSLNGDPHLEQDAMMRAMAKAGLMDAPRQPGEAAPSPYGQVGPRPMPEHAPSPYGAVSGFQDDKPSGPPDQPIPAWTPAVQQDFGLLGDAAPGLNSGPGVSGQRMGARDPQSQMGIPGLRATGEATGGMGVGARGQYAPDPDAAKRTLVESVVRGNLAGKANVRTREAQEAMRKAQLALLARNQTKSDWQRARGQEFVAQYNNDQRALMSQQLANQGVTPFDIERRQRIALGLGR